MMKLELVILTNYRLIRFTNDEILQNIDNCIERIKKHLTIESEI